MNRIFVCTTGALFFLSSIVSHGQEKPKLTVYTYDAFAADWGPGLKVKQAFEAVCNCVLAAWSRKTTIASTPHRTVSLNLAIRTNLF